MWFSLISLSISAIIASSIGFSIQDAKPHCPPPEEVEPCTCSDFGDVSTVCRNITEGNVLTTVFSKNPDWNIQRVHLDYCTIDYIPSSVLEYDSLKQINVSSSILVSLFDKTPVKTPAIDIYLYDTKLLRGLKWEIFKNSSLTGFGTFNTEIRHFGKDFKEYMPQSVKNLYFENSKTARISQQAFQRMVNLDTLTLTGGSLKSISRDMFPRPWNIKFWNLSQQKLTTLPKDIFDDLPQLIIFSVMKNFLTTIDEEVYTKSGASYYLNDNPIYCNCGVKWITTSGKQSFKRFIGKCEDPESFNGKELKNLKEEDFSFCQ